MALATVEHLVGIGALKADGQPTGNDRTRAETLLQLATGQVCVYVGADEATIVAEFESYELDAVAAVVAEVAGRRLKSPAAPTTTALTDSPAPWLSVVLTKRDEAALDRIASVGRLRGTSGGSGSVTNVRGDSWIEVTSADPQWVYL